jgi:hypothetical protein
VTEIIETKDCNEIAVTNNRTNAKWVTHKFAKAPVAPLPNHYDIRVTAEPESPPPAGFFNNAADRFVVAGRFVASGAPFRSGALTYNGNDSDPPLVYIFSI